MQTPISNLMAAHRAVIEGSQEIGTKGVEALTRFVELQSLAAQGLLVAGGDAAHGGPPDAMALARSSAEYAQRITQLLWHTHAEMTQLMTRQLSQLQALIQELTAAAVMLPTALQDTQPSASRRRHAGGSPPSGEARERTTESA